MEYYLMLTRKLKIEPNFWCSVEYAQRAGLRSERRNKVAYIYDDDQLVLPPIGPDRDFGESIPGSPIWSDLAGLPMYGQPSFLDYEYLYNPLAFDHMDGKSWATYRKNARKWPNRIGQGYRYERIGWDFSDKLIIDCFVEWLSTQGEDVEIHDDEVMLDYLLNGDNRMALITDDGIVRAVNVYDVNWKYINFRYSVCRNEGFLAEFARFCFYTDPRIRQMERLVNDGGILDRPALEFFKNKMNPVRVREVNSWRCK